MENKEFFEQLKANSLEWRRDEKKGSWVPACVKTEYVDGEHIKADTWYALKDGQFIEVKD